MAKLGVVVLGVVFVNSILETIAGSDNQKELLEENIRNSKQFACDRPMPVVFYWEEILSGELKDNVVRLVPPYTVINKCDYRCGGCPSVEEKCVSKENPRKKQLIFHKYIKSSPLPKFITVEVEEDTSCHCSTSDFQTNPIK